MLRKLFILFAFFPMLFLHSQEDDDYTFDLAISLGARCQTAIYLTQNHLRNQAFPFDWTITPFEALPKFFIEGGRNFLNPDNLIFNVGTFAEINLPQAATVDTNYGIAFMHDFDYPDYGNFITQTFSESKVFNFDKIKQKYDRRIKRFFELCNSSKKILFIRLDVTYDQVCLLKNVISNCFPNLDFAILAVGDAEEMKTPWGIDKVFNYYLYEPSFWPGDPDGWKSILSLFKFREFDPNNLPNSCEDETNFVR